MAPKVHRLRHTWIRHTHCQVDFRAYLEAFTADGRTEVHMEVSGIHGMFCPKAVETFLQDSSHRSSPPGVKKADHPGFRIHQEHGDTVGDGDAQKDSLGSGDMPVSVRFQNESRRFGDTRVIPVPGGGRPQGWGPNDGAMDLTGMDHRIEAKAAAQTFPVIPGTRIRGLAKQCEIPGRRGSPREPACGPLQQPGEIGLPPGMDPASSSPGLKQLPNRWNLNLRGVGAYHADGLPGVLTNDPENLSFCTKFHRFESNPNR